MRTRLVPFRTPCPYLPDRISSGVFFEGSLPPGDYESLLCQGWRRSGSIFYRYDCPGCSSCIPLRIPADRPADSRRARRLERMNSDLKIELLPAEMTDERLRLYEKYVRIRHEALTSVAEEEFAAHCISADAALTEYRDAAGFLCALGFLDILPGGFSSVYFAWEPGQQKRSLGAFSILAESRLAASMSMSWYYLGFWVPGARRMDYKADFPPFELALPDASSPGGRRWTKYASREEALESLRR